MEKKTKMRMRPSSGPRAVRMREMEKPSGWAGVGSSDGVAG